MNIPLLTSRTGFGRRPLHLPALIGAGLPFLRLPRVDQSTFNYSCYTLIMFISSVSVLLSSIFVEIAQVRASPQPSLIYQHRRADFNSTLDQSNGTSSGANLTSSHMVFAHFMVSKIRSSI